LLPRVGIIQRQPKTCNEEQAMSIILSYLCLFDKRRT
jgi:hypothetical protein